MSRKSNVVSNDRKLLAAKPDVVTIDQLTLDPKNARSHNQRGISTLKRSLEQYGQRKAIVALKGSNKVIAGNGTLQAAKDLGWKKIAVVFVDDDQAKATAYAIADNRTAELSNWDYETLGEVIDDAGSALESFELGFLKEELDSLLMLDLPEDDESEDDEEAEDKSVNDGIMHHKDMIRLQFPDYTIKPALVEALEPWLKENFPSVEIKDKL